MPLTLEMLLPLWYQLEPHNCAPHREPGMAALGVYEIETQNLLQPTVFTINPTPAHLLALEHAIRLRLKQKRWPWKLLQDTGDTITAVVNPEPERSLQVAAGPNEAIAITAAYLKACGVQVGGG